MINNEQLIMRHALLYEGFSLFIVNYTLFIINCTLFIIHYTLNYGESYY